MVLVLRLRRHAAVVAVAAVTIVALFEPLFISSSVFNRVYFGTDTRCAALFCGALCAFIGSNDGWRFLRSPWWGPRLGVVALTVIFWSAYALRQEGDRGLWNTGLILASLACAFGVVFVVERPTKAAARILSSGLLVAVGKRSYALYLWSYVLNTWLRDTGAAESFLVIGLSFLPAEISYRLVELPALGYKRYFTIPATAGIGSPPVREMAPAGSE
jgi:peptidoglycan/LPS O-acetylase OafA/YrhL